MGILIEVVQSSQDHCDGWIGETLGEHLSL
jgi:hypothetical protein